MVLRNLRGAQPYALEGLKYKRTQKSGAAAARRVLGDRPLDDRLGAVSKRLRPQDPVAAACSLIAAK
jgi:hypothetical protein